MNIALHGGTYYYTPVNDVPENCFWYNVPSFWRGVVDIFERTREFYPPGSDRIVFKWLGEKAL